MEEADFHLFSSDSDSDEDGEFSSDDEALDAPRVSTRFLAVAYLVLCMCAAVLEAARPPAFYVRDDTRPRTLKDLVQLFPTDEAFRLFFRFTADQLVVLMRALGIVPEEYSINNPCEPLQTLHEGCVRVAMSFRSSGLLSNLPAILLL